MNQNENNNQEEKGRNNEAIAEREAQLQNTHLVKAKEIDFGINPSAPSPCLAAKNAQKVLKVMKEPLWMNGK